MEDAARHERVFDRKASSHEVLFAVALFAVAFALRFIAARWLAGEPVWDGHYYDFGARRIAEGHGYSDDRIVDGQVEWHPWCHYPVGYSGYLAAFYWLFGARPWVLHVANAVSGALVAVVVFLLGKEELSLRRARLAGVLTAVHPGLVLYGALVMGEILAALGVLLAFWVAVRGARAWGAWRGVAAGALVLGVSALVRPQALLCAPFLALATGGPLLARIKVAALACAVALVPVLPWTARNCAVMDGCALVSTNAGWNLAIGSFPRATGRFETLRSSDGCREVTGQVQQDRCWFAYGLEHIAAAPGRWLGLVPAKLSHTFDHESFAVEYLREARPEDWPEPRRVAWRSAITALHRLLLVASPLAFIAFVVPKRRPAERRSLVAQGAALFVVAVAAALGMAAETPTFWPIVLGTCLLSALPLPGRPAPLAVLLLPVALLGTTALTHAVFFGDDRYHMVVTPALCLLAAAMLRQNTHGADTRGVRAAGTSSS
jgi:4-amino-4-deoxy-L-arabinose transferase-like glycosyltransferase